MKKEKKWIQPKLIVLVRSYSPEMVLSGCKGEGVLPPGNPGEYYAVCYMEMWPGCQYCDAWAAT